ncbi:MAG: Transcriptional regulator, PadR family [Ktedonobacterales bacterium]|jgi:DNA-binding PadR family transcriptional regulator|nr:MAG: Transcriptional regulator, PadR family [Ktedonobacterales bacterium]
MMDENAREAEALLPLTPAVFQILLALAGGERHGYGIMREIAENTEGKMRLGPGTLYRSIKQMLAAGLIEESDERPDPALDDERRRYYRLSGFGQRVAEAEARRLAQLVNTARARRLLPEVGTAPVRGGA